VTYIIQSGCDVTGPQGFKEACGPDFTIPTTNGSRIYDVRVGDYQVDINRDNLVRCEFESSQLVGINNNQKNMHRLGDPLASPVVTGALQTYLPEIRHRIPGGNVAHGYHANGTIGVPVASRPTWRDVFGGGQLPVRYGLDEFQDYLQRSQSTAGNPITWVLNLVTTDSTTNNIKEPDAVVAADNAILAQNLYAMFPQAEGVIWQFGNENDRFSSNSVNYQWQPSILIPSVQANATAIRAVDPWGQFLAFTRHHNYTYKVGHPLAGQVYTWQALHQDLFSVPEMRSFGFHAYVDTLDLDGNQAFLGSENYSVRYYLGEAQKVIDYQEAIVRPGERAIMHWTEFSRRRSSDQVNTDGTTAVQASQGSCVSCVDLLIGSSLIPQIEYANYHASHAGAWRLFDENVINNTLQPLPIFFGLYLAKEGIKEDTYESITTSLNQSGYLGEYDFRAVGYGDGSGTLTVVAVNRHRQPITVTINDAALGTGMHPVQNQYMDSPAGTDPDTDLTSTIVNGPTVNIPSTSGQMQVTLPASSVNVLTVG